MYLFLSNNFSLIKEKKKIRNIRVTDLTSTINCVLECDLECALEAELELEKKHECHQILVTLETTISRF